jgi:hypothetical protein
VLASLKGRDIITVLALLVRRGAIAVNCTYKRSPGRLAIGAFV